jgi:hypothetical protein
MTITESTKDLNCRICREPLKGQTVVRIEAGQTPICGQCWSDMDEMSADLNDMMEEQEEAKGRWDTD